MEIMRLPFLLLTLSGCWRPPSWSTSSKRLIYNVYTVVIFCVIHAMTFGQFMDMVLNVDNTDDFSDNSYLMLGAIGGNCKMWMLLWNHRNIVMMADSFKEGFFLPLDDIEATLQRKFDTTSGTNTLYYFILGELTVWIMMGSALFSNFPRRELMYRAWLPYDCYSSTLLFILNYIHQGSVLLFNWLLHAACDTLIMGFLIHTCCQLEILSWRLKGIENGSNRTLKKCIKHHEQIYRFAEQLNETFRISILFQFTASMLIICINMYQITKSTGVDGMFLQVIFYLMALLIQIFIYCWYGNEMKLKSRDVSDAVFQMNWANFDVDARSTILTVMQRTAFPIELSGFYVVTMDLDTFVNILKTSYSAYNLLKQA